MAKQRLRQLFRLIQRFHRDERGQAMTEAAIILPIFITTIAMTLEFSVLATVKSVVNYAAYSSCRAGIVHNANPTFMVSAGAMAISPVTQSVILPNKPFTTGAIGGYDRYGRWEWEDGSTGSAFMEAGAATRTAARTGDFAAMTLIAMAHFTQVGSGAEYLALGLRNTNHASAPLAQMAQAVSDLDFAGMEAAARKLDGLLMVPGLLTQPINRIQVLAPTPADGEDVAAVTGHLFNPFEWGTSDLSLIGSDSVIDEDGDEVTGASFIAVRAGRDPQMRLRVRFIHRHMLMFPFLRMVYDNVLDRRDVDDQEMEVVQLAGALGMVEIWGDCVMRMQSSFTLGLK